MEEFTINKFLRYQRGLTVQHLFPGNKGVCACGCGKPAKRRWHSKECTEKALAHFWVIKGDNKEIRKQLFESEEGVCRMCGNFDINWQADHIVPVHQGGGGCGIDNFQTLCVPCHNKKSFSYEELPF